MGFSLLLFVLLKYDEQGFGNILARGEWEFHCLGLIAVATTVLGARLIILALLGFWTLLCFGILLSSTYGVLYFPAAEWTLWVSLPIALCAVIVVAMVRQVRRGADASSVRYHAEVDWGVTRVFRTLACVTLAFAALHKANVDFFDPKVSCVGLTDFLHDWWSVPPILTSWLTPAWVVGLEAVFPLLLWRAPQLGLLLTTCLMFEFGSIGAVAFASIVTTMSAAFLPDSDGASIRDGLKRAWFVPVTLILAAWTFGALVYRGSYPLPVIGLFQAHAITVICAAAWCLWRSIAGASAPPQAKRERASLPGLAMITGLAILGVLNGLTPYLGLKFQFSFAMLSNLRVDDSRWNSLIFPRSMRLTEYDPYLHVTAVRYTVLSSGETVAENAERGPALYSPTGLRYRIQDGLNKGVQVTLDFTYQGESHSYLDATDPAELYALIDSFPHTPHWQSRLTLGPQSCVH